MEQCTLRVGSIWTVFQLCYRLYVGDVEFLEPIYTGTGKPSLESTIILCWHVCMGCSAIDPHVQCIYMYTNIQHIPVMVREVLCRSTHTVQ